MLPAVITLVASGDGFLFKWSSILQLYATLIVFISNTIIITLMMIMQWWWWPWE